jgi:hypothetical protein
VTLSGAASGTFACITVANYTASTNETAFALEVANPAPLGNIVIVISKSGLLNGAVTFSNSDSNEKAGLTVIGAGSPMPAWSAIKNTGDPDQGTYTVSATLANGPATSDGMLLNASGHASATLAPVAGSGASGTINLTASF